MSGKKKSDFILRKELYQSSILWKLSTANVKVETGIGYKTEKMSLEIQTKTKTMSMKTYIIQMKGLNILMMSLISANQKSVSINEALEYTYDEFG